MISKNYIFFQKRATYFYIVDTKLSSAHLINWRAQLFSPGSASISPVLLWRLLRVRSIRKIKKKRIIITQVTRSNRISMLPLLRIHECISPLRWKNTLARSFVVSQARAKSKGTAAAGPLRRARSETSHPLSPQRAAAASLTYDVSRPRCRCRAGRRELAK